MLELGVLEQIDTDGEDSKQQSQPTQAPSLARQQRGLGRHALENNVITCCAATEVVGKKRELRASVFCGRTADLVPGPSGLLHRRFYTPSLKC